MDRSDTASITIRPTPIREDALKRTKISEDDEGKRVVNSTRKKIEIVKTVKTGGRTSTPLPESQTPFARGSGGETRTRTITSSNPAASPTSATTRFGASPNPRPYRAK
ncbi:hypothetical protein ACOZ35_04940 [Halorubrum xinjiangense]|uniref:hypothetical protein n=1 Tax=Halorubrum xinjiangense TaxID=261291 RepID=UPI003C6F66F8